SRQSTPSVSRVSRSSSTMRTRSGRGISMLLEDDEGARNAPRLRRYRGTCGTDLLEELLPLRADFLLQLLARLGHRWKFCKVIPRPAGIDDRLRAERRVVAVGDEHRVVLRAHAALNDVDVDRRVAARR